MENNNNIAKWMTLAAVFMYAAAVFHVADGKIILGVVFFGSATCFMAAAGKFRKKETVESDRKIEQENEG